MTQLVKNRGVVLSLIAALIVGVILVLISPTEEDKIQEDTHDVVFNESKYEEQLERRLKGLIEQIDGVGSVSVMITLEGSALYTYAQDLSENIASDGDVKKETSIVMSAKSSSIKEAVISGYTMPEIKGAAVVCQNKLNAVLLEKIIRTVSASLGISTDKIYVTN